MIAKILGILVMVMLLITLLSQSSTGAGRILNLMAAGIALAAGLLLQRGGYRLLWMVGGSLLAVWSALSIYRLTPPMLGSWLDGAMLVTFAITLAVSMSNSPALIPAVVTSRLPPGFDTSQNINGR